MKKNMKKTQLKLRLFFKTYFYFIFFISFTFSITAQQSETIHLLERAKKYKEKYNTSSIYDKITDNFGENCPSVYGTRNMRVVLNGIVYRGGANNYYNKNNKRENENPMPEEGLVNLLNEKFSTVIYLYSKNFADSKKSIGPDKNGKYLNYLQNSLSNEKEIRQFLELVYSNIKDSTAGPIYIHCWNGWHQSGYASAIILMQFCGFTNDEAYSYWEKCAAGDLSKYSHIKKAIYKFKPYKEFQISDEIKSIICPGE